MQHIFLKCHEHFHHISNICVWYYSKITFETFENKMGDSVKAFLQLHFLYH